MVLRKVVSQWGETGREKRVRRALVRAGWGSGVGAEGAIGGSVGRLIVEWCRGGVALIF